MFVVEVTASCIGAHNHLMPSFACLNSPFKASPRHDDQIFGKTKQLGSFQHFVPTDGTFSCLFHQLANAAGHVRLQLMCMLQAKFLHPFLAGWARLPSRMGALISSNVDVGIAEQLRYLADGILKEGEHLLIAGTQDFLKDSPAVRNRIWSLCTAQLRVGRKQG
ncbi:hypothetical protein SDC9_89900 [bioreactor metagenome]|uniref:Uncharacterized protein n=1 Tax=bioreactor metagenome TaxID=1076179 RepID=A0A644ZR41_9ZZZZ